MMEDAEQERLKAAALATIEKYGMEEVVDRLVDNGVSGFVDCSTTDKTDIYANLLLNGCVGYGKMDLDQLATALSQSCLVDGWEDEDGE